MRWILLLVPALLEISFVRAQNLVPNGDFESFTGVPYNYGQYYFCAGWSNVNGMTTGYPYASPDYFHGIPSSLNYFGTNAPFSGYAHMGICTYHAPIGEFREYLSMKLSATLIPGQLYYISFAVARGNGNYSSATNNIGIHFSEGPLTQSTAEHIPVIPQLEITSVIQSTAWQQYHFTFAPTAAFDHITIGNFRDNANTSCLGADGRAYYFIDKIEVNECFAPAFTLGNDTILCEGDTLALSTGISNAVFQWQDGSTNDSLLVTSGGLYWVDVTMNGCIKSDSIFIAFDSCKTQAPAATYASPLPALIIMPNVFTPDDNGINDRFLPVVMEAALNARLKIMNRWGQVMTETDLAAGWDGRCDGVMCSNGVYYWIIEYTDPVKGAASSSGFITLLR